MARRPPPEGLGGVPDPDDVEVRHLRPDEATKSYRCPGCDHTIPPGHGHLVVVPRAAPDLRRHWHAPCWIRVAPPPVTPPTPIPPSDRPRSAAERRARRAHDRRR